MQTMAKSEQSFKSKMERVEAILDISGPDEARKIADQLKAEAQRKYIEDEISKKALEKAEKAYKRLLLKIKTDQAAGDQVNGDTNHVVTDSDRRAEVMINTRSLKHVLKGLGDGEFALDKEKSYKHAIERLLRNIHAEYEAMPNYSEETWNNFRGLVDLYTTLIIYDVKESKSLILTDGTVRENEIINALDNAEARNFVTQFIRHPMIDLARLDDNGNASRVDLDTLSYSGDLPNGVVGRMVTAAFLEVRKRFSNSDDHTLTTEESCYSIDGTLGTGRITKLFETELPNANLMLATDFGAHGNQQIDLNIRDTLNQVPPQMREVLAFMARYTFSLIDGSMHAARYTETNRLASAKLTNGGERDYVTLVGGEIAYRIAKGKQRGWVAGTTEFIDIRESEFWPKLKAKHRNAVSEFMEKLHQYEWLENEQYDRIHRIIEIHNLIFKPKEWSEFPSLTGFIIPDRPETARASYYKNYREALFEILDRTIKMIASEGDFAVDSDQSFDKVIKTIEGGLSSFNSQVARSFQYFPEGWMDRRDDPVFRLVRSALVTYVAHIMMKVQGETENKEDYSDIVSNTEQWLAWRSGLPSFLIRRKDERLYKRRLIQVASAIWDTFVHNDSLTVFRTDIAKILFTEEPAHPEQPISDDLIGGILRPEWFAKRRHPQYALGRYNNSQRPAELAADITDVSTYPFPPFDPEEGRKAPVGSKPK